MAKLKQSKNREEILEREKENAIKEGVTTKERIKGNLKTASLVRDPRTKTGQEPGKIQILGPDQTRTQKISKSRTEPDQDQEKFQISDRFGPVGPRTGRSVDP